MRKYFMVFVTICALSLFTALAAAQTSSSSNNNSSSSSSMQNGQSNTSSMNNEQASNSDTNKTIEGCIVKENTDYFIQPASGERERLSSSQDLSSQVGHHVRVEGTEQNATASNDRNSTSGSASAETQNNANGSIAGNAGSSNATGTSASANNNWTGKDFLVTKVETVSESCPADIQNKIDQNKQK